MFEAFFPETFDPGPNSLRLSLASSAVFLLSLWGLALVPNAYLGFFRWQGWVGVILGFLSLLMLRKRWLHGVKEFDWPSIAFLIGIFIVIGSVNQVGLLKDFADLMMRSGLTSAFVLFFIITWLSVLLSAFIDNVPYTVLMIPVCGMPEKRGYKIELGKYLKIAVPFTFFAVLIAMLITHLFWYGF